MKDYEKKEGEWVTRSVMMIVRGGGTALLLLLLVSLLTSSSSGQEDEEEREEEEEGQDCPEAMDCNKDLLPGQFLCLLRNVDPATQQLKDCMRSVEGIDKAPETCEALQGIVCKPTCNETFTRQVDCKWTNGYQYDTALLLSVFLGMFGADRFYLGYPAIGLLKFSTLGFFFIGHLVDIILIASQSLGPADGSHYVINYFGAGLTPVRVSDDTVRRYQADWN